MPKNIESLYLHFPFCLHLCNYCDFYKKVPQNIELDYQNYHNYLTESFIVHNNLIEKIGYSFVPLKTFYIGGGTPSLWGVRGKKFLEQFLKEKNIQLSNECEFTLEVNPGAWTDEVLQEWMSLGANRFSLGIQSLNPEMIKYLDRVHSIEDVYATLAYFRDNQLNFSMDFMLGLPHSKENKRDVIAELEIALKYNPSHFSVYILTVKDNYKHFSHLPDEEWIEKEFLDVSEFLQSKGFAHYEVSNFARPGKQSQHNLNYWRSKSVAALGPSATGFLAEDRLRYKWKPNSPEIEVEELTKEEFALEQVYMAVRSEEGLSLNRFKPEFMSIAESWVQKGYAHINSDHLTLNSKGYLLLDSLMNDLFAYKII